jgi:hypothetical protein
MQIIWPTKEIEVRLWSNVVGLTFERRRPERIVLSPEEVEELKAAGHQGELYKKRLLQVLPYGRKLG